MNKKNFTFIFALTFILGGIVNAQTIGYANKQKAGDANKINSQATNLTPNTPFVKGQPSFKTDNPVIKGRPAKSSKAMIFQTDFSGGLTGWETIGLGPTNWATSTSNNAGGTAPELRLNWNPSFTGASYCTSPVINTTGYTSLSLEFKLMMDNYNANLKTVGVATTIDNGATWLVVWSEDLTTDADITAQIKEITINNAHVGNADFRFAFFFTGYTFDIDYYYIDDVTLGQPEAHDLGVIALSPSFVESGNTANPTVTIKNYGANEETAYTVVLTDGGTYTSTVNVTTAIAVGAEAIISMDSWTPADGTHTLTATVTVTDDTYAANNQLTSSCNVLEIINAYAFVYDDVASTNKTGIFSIPASIFTEQATVTPMIRGYAWKESTLYALTATGDFGTVNTTDGTYTLIGATGVTGNFWTNLACDPTSGIIYGFHISGSYPAFAIKTYSFNETTGVATLVSTSSHTGTAAMYAFDNTGTLYAIEHQETGNGKFYTMDITNGDMTLIGDMGGIVSPSFQGMAFDFDNNVLYYQASGDLGEFQGTYSINTTTGEPTLVDATPASLGQVMGIVFPYQLPGAYANFTVTNGTDPIEGAIINVNNNNYTTDALGQASSYLLVGDYSYTVTAFGYETVNSTTDITIVDGVDVAVPVTMTALNNFDVTFNIKNNLDAPLNAVVTVNYGGNLYQTATAVAGTITMTAVPAGTYTFDVVLEDYVSQTNLALVVVDAAVIKNVTLVEVMNDPYGLAIEVIDNTALFSWNNAQGWDESFEISVPPTDWTVVNTNATENWKQVGTVTFDPDIIAPMDGSFQAEIYWEYGHQDEWLITDEFIVPNNGNLKFWSFSGAQGSTHLDHYYVKISTDGGTNWTVLWDAVTSTTTPSVYSEVMIPLESYAGQDVKLAWNAVDGDGEGLWFAWIIDKVSVGTGAKGAKALESYKVYLDDLENHVATTTAGITEHLFEDVTGTVHTAGVRAIYETGESDIVTIDFDITVGIDNVKQITAVYPNPSTGIYNIITENATVIVTDITGRVILTKDIRNNGHIDLSAQPNGIYFLNIGTSNLKVVKQ